MTRLPGSGTVPRLFAQAVLVIAAVFAVVWGQPQGLILVGLAFVPALRSFFVGVFLAGDAVLVRGWFRSYRYGPGELTAVDAIPYWKFLDPKEPILSLLKFRPTAGWVREISATVSWKERTMAQAVAIRRHLGLDENP